MKKFSFCKLILAVVFFMSGFQGCAQQQNQIELRAGFQIRTYKNPAGHEYLYSLFYPYLSNKERVKIPLVIFLNGTGENGTNGKSIGNNFGLQIWEMQEECPFVAIAPQCSLGGNWHKDSLDTEMALGIIEEVIQQFNIDEDRVYLTGVSGGGNGTWIIGSEYAEKFAAIVPLCGSSSGNIQKLAQYNMPIWNFYNAGDTVGLVRSNRNYHLELIKSGLSPHVTEYQQEGHNCWDKAYRNKHMFRWMLMQNRAINQSKTNTTKYSLLDLSTLELDGKCWTNITTEILSVHSVESTVPLNCGRFPSNCDIHLEVQFSPTETFELLIETLTDNYKYQLLIPYRDNGKGVLLDQNKNVLAYINTLSQNELITQDSTSWNDVRLTLKNGNIQLSLNGVEALQCKIENSEVTEFSLFVSPPTISESNIRLRNFRWRRLNN